MTQRDETDIPDEAVYRFLMVFPMSLTGAEQARLRRALAAALSAIAPRS